MTTVTNPPKSLDSVYSNISRAHMARELLRASVAIVDLELVKQYGGTAVEACFQARLDLHESVRESDESNSHIRVARSVLRGVVNSIDEMIAIFVVRLADASELASFQALRETLKRATASEQEIIAIVRELRR